MDMLRPVSLLPFLIATATVLCFSAHAQVRKCTGPDGKVTYSDFVCGANTAKETSVKTNANTVDASGYRQDAQRSKTAHAVDEAVQRDASKCKFSSFKNGDSKGQELAAAAKQECLDNIVAKVSGQPTSLDAYNFWKDHSTKTSAERQAALNRISAAANAQAIANSNRNAIGAATDKNANRTFTCKPSLYQNALDCK
jgi:hypothetical protein